MKLTTRGRFVVWAFGLALLAGLMMFLSAHTQTTPCHHTIDGLVCGSTWKW